MAEEKRKLFAINLSYVVAVEDADGHIIRVEAGGADQLFHPYSLNLEQKVTEKVKELKEGAAG